MDRNLAGAFVPDTADHMVVWADFVCDQVITGNSSAQLKPAAHAMLVKPPLMQEELNQAHLLELQKLQLGVTCLLFSNRIVGKFNSLTKAARDA